MERKWKDGGLRWRERDGEEWVGGGDGVGSAVRACPAREPASLPLFRRAWMRWCGTGGAVRDGLGVGAARRWVGVLVVRVSPFPLLIFLRASACVSPPALLERSAGAHLVWRYAGVVCGVVARAGRAKRKSLTREKNGMETVVDRENEGVWSDSL